MSLKDLWYCITGRVMENNHLLEAVWRARHFPNVVFTSSTLVDWMSDWMEEGADIPDGVTMRHETAQLLAVLKQHTKDVPVDKEVKAAYNNVYSLQAEYAGVDFNYLEIFLMMLSPGEYQEQQEEYMDNPRGSEAPNLRAFGSKGGGTADPSRSKSRDGNQHGGESKRSFSQSGAHRKFRNRRDSVSSNTSQASSEASGIRMISRSPSNGGRIAPIVVSGATWQVTVPNQRSTKSLLLQMVHRAVPNRNLEPNRTMYVTAVAERVTGHQDVPKRAGHKSSHRDLETERGLRTAIIIHRTAIVPKIAGKGPRTEDEGPDTDTQILRSSVVKVQILRIPHGPSRSLTVRMIFVVDVVIGSPTPRIAQQSCRGMASFQSRVLHAAEAPG